MDISQKIREIRQQPESVRIKYMYASVIISMLLVLIIWLFSLKLDLRGDEIKSQNNSSSWENKNNLMNGIEPPHDISSEEKNNDLNKENKLEEGTNTSEEHKK